MRIFTLLSLYFIALHTPTALADEPAKVILFGTFHFSNPGLDAIKTEQVDVTSPENQTYLIKLASRIANNFKPTEVLLECDPKEQSKMSSRFSEFTSGNFELPVNETYQIGFRVAKEAKLKNVVCFDERDVQWKAEALLKSMPKDNPALDAEFKAHIASLTSDITSLHETGSLKSILQKHNEKESDDRNKYLYLLTNQAGAGSNFNGADSTASWWHRNFRMYANIQQAATPSSKILVIAGQGHTAILKDFVQLDKKARLVDIKDYL